MWHIGIDLHRRTVVIAAVNDSGQAFESVTHACREPEAILEAVARLKPFRAVIEATATYRWLYELLSEHGTVLLAHPAKLRLMTQRRARTDKLDCQLLANLLRINQIPLAYIPPKSFQQLREITRCRASLVPRPGPSQGRPSSSAGTLQPRGSLSCSLRSLGTALVPATVLWSRRGLGA